MDTCILTMFTVLIALMAFLVLWYDRRISRLKRENRLLLNLLEEQLRLQNDSFTACQAMLRQGRRTGRKQS